MMDITEEFSHLTERSIGVIRDDDEKVKVSLNLRLDDVLMADRLAKVLGTTRNEIFSKIIQGGLPDAVRGYFRIVGDDPLEFMTWTEFNEKISQGEYFG
jgi:hypothetical protein